MLAFFVRSTRIDSDRGNTSCDTEGLIRLVSVVQPGDVGGPKHTKGKEAARAMSAGLNKVSDGVESSVPFVYRSGSVVFPLWISFAAGPSSCCI
jgi:hypothetical protein